MTRRASRVTHDEVRRMVKAVQSCGLPVGRIEFDGERLAVIVGEGLIETPPVAPVKLEAIESLDEYKAWRERQRAGGVDRRP